MKKRLADAEAELDGSARRVAARKMLDQHDERDSLEEDGNGDALPPSNTREEDGQAKVEEEDEPVFDVARGKQRCILRRRGG